MGTFQSGGKEKKGNQGEQKGRTKGAAKNGKFWKEILEKTIGKRGNSDNPRFLENERKDRAPWPKRKNRKERNPPGLLGGRRARPEETKIQSLPGRERTAPYIPNPEKKGAVATFLGEWGKVKRGGRTHQRES